MNTPLSASSTVELTDQPTNTRQGEELDVRKVDHFLKEMFAELKGELSIKQYPGGASNLTYLLKYDNREFVLRRPPFGTMAKSAHDMIREAKVIQKLSSAYPYVPEIFAVCEDHSVLGCDFYIMERLVGIIPRQDLPPELNMSSEDVRKLCLNVIDRLIALHKIDPEKADLTSLGKGSGYVARQIKGWAERYQKAATENSSGFKTVMEWLDVNQPEDVANCVIHNDYRFDNVVLNPDNPFDVIGVLDWEMATLGDPLMDLGNTLAYWVEAEDDPQMQFMRRQPTHLKGMLKRDEVVEYYLKETGFNVNSFRFYEVYGLFRLAVIIQQIYYRFHNGQTQDKRFANFIHAANYLETRCMKLINSDLK